MVLNGLLGEKMMGKIMNELIPWETYVDTVQLLHTNKSIGHFLISSARTFLFFWLKNFYGSEKSYSCQFLFSQFN